jgi:hypothetical protein
MEYKQIIDSWENNEALALMLGQTFSVIVAKKGSDLNSCYSNDEERLLELTLENDKYKFVMLHQQDCCEAVWLEDITGDLEDLKDSPILLAEEVTNKEDAPLDKDTDSYTWTYYKFSTIKGSVTLRWYGESNGYYSEKVNIEVFEKI